MELTEAMAQVLTEDHQDQTRLPRHTMVQMVVQLARLSKAHLHN